MKRLVVLLIAMLAGGILGMGCGAELTVQTVVNTPDPGELPSPSDTSSAALLSGFGVSRGGDRYKIVQSLGGTVAKPVQESEGGVYTIKLQSGDPPSEDEL